MFRESSLGRKMHTLRRSCMTLLLWKVSLFIVLWAPQWSGWACRVLSNCSGSQHSKANSSSSSSGQQKHRGTSLCRFHSCTKPTGRPVNKRESVVRAEGQAREPDSSHGHRESASQAEAAILGAQEGRDAPCLLTTILALQTRVNRHSENLDICRWTKYHNPD